jgi:hypothetical protein
VQPPVAVEASYLAGATNEEVTTGGSRRVGSRHRTLGRTERRAPESGVAVADWRSCYFQCRRHPQRHARSRSLAMSTRTPNVS